MVGWNVLDGADTGIYCSVYGNRDTAGHTCCREQYVRSYHQTDTRCDADTARILLSHTCADVFWRQRGLSCDSHNDLRVASSYKTNKPGDPRSID